MACRADDRVRDIGCAERLRAALSRRDRLRSRARPLQPSRRRLDGLSRMSSAPGSTTTRQFICRPCADSGKGEAAVPTTPAHEVRNLRRTGAIGEPAATGRSCSARRSPVARRSRRRRPRLGPRPMRPRFPTAADAGGWPWPGRAAWTDDPRCGEHRRRGAGCRGALCASSMSSIDRVLRFLRSAPPPPPLVIGELDCCAAQAIRRQFGVVAEWLALIGRRRRQQCGRHRRTAQLRQATTAHAAAPRRHHRKRLASPSPR